LGGRGSAPDPAGGAYSTPPHPLARLRALLLKGREGGGEKGREGEEEGWAGGGERRGGDEVVPPPFGRKLRPYVKCTTRNYRIRR